MDSCVRERSEPPESCSPGARARRAPPATALGDRIAGAGPRGLSDLELVALVLGRGHPGERVWRAVRALTARADLGELALLGCRELAATAGLGAAPAASLAACFELGRRLYRPDSGPRLLGQASDVHAVARDLELARREHFVAFYLDARNRVLARETISVGTLSASLVHPREVFAPAIERRAASLVIAHNHPSGDPEPSDDDVALTRRLVQVGILIGIEVLDHVIIGHGAYVSLKSRGLM
jgi:DNA repair protein RadC